VLGDYVAIEKSDESTHLQEPAEQDLCDRRFARSGRPGEEGKVLDACQRSIEAGGHPMRL